MAIARSITKNRKLLKQGLRNTTFVDSELLDSHSSSSTLEKYTMQPIHSPATTLSTTTPELSQPKLTRFPPEIREMIFKDVLEYDKFEGKTPSLLVALRGTKDLYDEAIYHFRKTNTNFAVNDRNIENCAIMGKSALTSIKELAILLSPLLNINKFSRHFPNKYSFQNIHVRFSDDEAMFGNVFCGQSSSNYSSENLEDWVALIKGHLNGSPSTISITTKKTTSGTMLLFGAKVLRENLVIQEGQEEGKLLGLGEDEDGEEWWGWDFSV